MEKNKIKFDPGFNNDPITISVNDTYMDENDTTPVILNPELRETLENKLGQPINTMGDLSKCWNRGIIQPLDPKIVRALMNASANWDCDDDDDGYDLGI